MPAPILNENIGGMNIGYTVFCFLVVKLTYDGCKTAYAKWYAENCNPYRAYRQAVNENR